MQQQAEQQTGQVLGPQTGQRVFRGADSHFLVVLAVAVSPAYVHAQMFSRGLPSHPLLFIPLKKLPALPHHRLPLTGLQLLAPSPAEMLKLNAPAASLSPSRRRGTRLLCSSKTRVTVTKMKPSDGCNTGRTGNQYLPQALALWCRLRPLPQHQLTWFEEMRAVTVVRKPGHRLTGTQSHRKLTRRWQPCA